MNFLIRLLITWIGVILSSYLLPGVHIRSLTSALWVALVLALLNIFLKPLLIILTIPVTIITFGLFLLVINAVLILIADDLISGFFVESFWWAFLFSIILSIITYLLGKNRK
ncbi:MAG: phage holin family protein [Bacteroidales bacterium]|nr:phage holin family protein [Bacteroidales bacterium]